MSKLSLKQLYLCAFVSGVISTLAMAPLNWWPVLFLAFPALIYCIDQIHSSTDNLANETEANIKINSRAKLYQFFFLGWSFGFGYFVVSLYWLGASFLVEPEKFAWALPFAVTLLPAALGLFFALAFLLMGLFWNKGPERLVIFSLAIFLADWLRGHSFTGFPWNLIGHSLTGQMALMQNVTLFGIYGLSAIAALIFASPIVFMSAGRKHKQELVRRSFPFILSLLILAGLFLYGQVRLNSAGPTKFVEGLELVLVQPNIPQTDKVGQKGRRKALIKTLELTETLPPLNTQKYQNRVIIWPETAIPFALNKSPNIQIRLDQLLPENSTLITGAFHIEQAAADKKLKVYNSLFVVNDKGEIANIYDKHHLVPFGEYLPFPHLLRFLGLEAIADERGGFQTGPKPKPITLKNGPAFLPSICYEAIFPLSHSTASQGAKWLLNISNDGWFGKTVGPHQHAHQVKIRAIETGLPMVRVVNGGISAIYDGFGRTIQQTALGTKQLVISKLPRKVTLSAETLPKEIFSFLILAAFLILISTAKTSSKLH